MPKEKKGVRLDHISKIYQDPKTGKDFYAVKDTSLTIEPGSFVTLLGPSGCGKSTLLNIVGLLDNPSSGSITIDGVEVGNMSDRRLARFRNEKLGFVFQSFHLINSLNVIDNVELPLIYRSMSASERRRRAKDVLERVGLSHRMFHTPSQLSGGQWQRVAIARAIVGNPEIILADEPTGALDYNTGKPILKLLHSMSRNNGMTVIILNHNSALTAMADRVIQVKNGTVISEEINDRPVPVEEIEW